MSLTEAFAISDKGQKKTRLQTILHRANRGVPCRNENLDISIILDGSDQALLPNKYVSLAMLA